MSILDEILTRKHEEVARAKEATPPAVLAERAAAVARPVRSLHAALLAGPAPRVIAEVKRRSPSKGEIRKDFDPSAIAKSYADGGAAALSVLTDEPFFGGHLDYLREIRALVDLPLLRKDFVVDAYQLDEARLAGADAVLLIVAALEPAVLERLHREARARSLDVLVEVHDDAELEFALGLGATLVGINNRDLRTFETDLATTERLAPRARAASPDCVVVAESGIFTGADMRRLEASGAGAHLVGESLMRQPDPGAALRELREAHAAAPGEEARG